jgi:hypothetical protein
MRQFLGHITTGNIHVTADPAQLYSSVTPTLQMRFAGAPKGEVIDQGLIKAGMNHLISCHGAHDWCGSTHRCIYPLWFCLLIHQWINKQIWWTSLSNDFAFESSYRNVCWIFEWVIAKT